MKQSETGALCSPKVNVLLRLREPSQPLMEEFFSTQLPENTAAASWGEDQCSGKAWMGLILERKPGITRNKR